MVALDTGGLAPVAEPGIEPPAPDPAPRDRDRVAEPTRGVPLAYSPERCTSTVAALSIFTGMA